MILCFLALIFSYSHAIHIGVIEIVPAENTEFLELRVKLFTDDLEEAIRGETGQGVLFRDTAALAQHQALINSYIQNHLSVAINGQKMTLVHQKSVPENDTSWLYFSIDFSEKINLVDVQSDILLDVFPDQTNVLHLELEDDVKLIRLSANKTRAEVTFD